MTNCEIKTLIEDAKAYAIKRGHEHDADDFSQEVYIAIARGRKASFEQLLVDYLRGTYGDTRRASGAASSNTLRHTVGSYDEIEFKVDENALGKRDESDEKNGRLHLRARAALSRKQIVVYELFFERGMSPKEIQILLGYSYENVTQYIFQIRKALEKIAPLEQLWDYYQADPDASKFIIEWICV